MSSGEVNNRLITDTTEKITPHALENSNAKLLPINSVMIALNGQGRTKGMAAILQISASCNQSLAAIICNSRKLHYFYLYHYLRSRYKEIRGLVGDDERDGLNLEIVRSLPIYLPPLPEQFSIATFLDRETARIDALIEKKERQIELLKEKRAALISHAITKGLDHSVKMKDSGVDWLGKIPAHWTVERIKWVAKLDSGHTPSKQVEEYWIDCNIPWVSLNDTGYLKNHDYIAETSQCISELGMANSSAHLLPERTVVFTRDATIGLAAITTRPMAVSQHIIAWICGSKIWPDYLLFVFYSMTQELERLTMGSTIKTIGMPDVFELVTPVPPLEEQKKIADSIFRKKMQINKIVEKISESIVELHEYRSALISAAVTGKIDVRQEAKA